MFFSFHGLLVIFFLNFFYADLFLERVPAAIHIFICVIGTSSIRFQKEVGVHVQKSHGFGYAWNIVEMDFQIWVKRICKRLAFILKAFTSQQLWCSTVQKPVNNYLEVNLKLIELGRLIGKDWFIQRSYWNSDNHSDIIDIVYDPLSIWVGNPDFCGKLIIKLSWSCSTS